MTLYVYGHDPASKADSYGLVIHRIEERESQEEIQLPKLQTLRAWSNTRWPDIEKQFYGYDIKQNNRIEHVEGLYERFPPALQVFDYTNEKSWSETAERRFGEDNVLLVNFTIANKLMLKQAGLRIMQMGYTFPTLDRIPAKIYDPTSRQEIEIKRWVGDTIEQLLHEEIIPTASGKISFDHPEGQHNDLAIAWELSVYGCLKLMISGFGEPAAAAGHFVKNRKDEEEKYFPELRKRGINIHNVQVREPM